MGGVWVCAHALIGSTIDGVCVCVCARARPEGQLSNTTQGSVL